MQGAGFTRKGTGKNGREGEKGNYLCPLMLVKYPLGGTPHRPGPHPAAGTPRANPTASDPHPMHPRPNGPTHLELYRTCGARVQHAGNMHTACGEHSRCTRATHGERACSTWGTRRTHTCNMLGLCMKHMQDTHVRHMENTHATCGDTHRACGEHGTQYERLHSLSPLAGQARPQRIAINPWSLLSAI